MNLFTKQKRFTDLKNTLMVTTGEESGGGIDYEFGTDLYTLLYFKRMTNKELLLKKFFLNFLKCRYLGPSTDQLTEISGQGGWGSAFFIINFCWSSITLQCCVSFYCTAK